jgi:hypothetical protein
MQQRRLYHLEKGVDLQESHCQQIKTSHHNIKKTINDYLYFLGSSSQASEHERITEYLINYVRKTREYGNNIGIALKCLTVTNKDIWRVTLKSGKAWFEACCARSRFKTLPKGSRCQGMTLNATLADPFSSEKSLNRCQIMKNDVERINKLLDKPFAYFLCMKSILADLISQQ